MIRTLRCQMRKPAILFFLTILSIEAHAQIPIEGVSSYIKDYLGEWESAYPPISISANGRYKRVVTSASSYGNNYPDYLSDLIPWISCKSFE